MRKNLTSLFVAIGLLVAAGPSFAQTPVVVYKPTMSNTGAVAAPAASAQLGLDAIRGLFVELNYTTRWLNDSKDALIVESNSHGLKVPVYVTLDADSRAICMQSCLVKLDDKLAARAPWDKMVESQETLCPVRFHYQPASGWLSIWYMASNYQVTKTSLNKELAVYLDVLFGTRQLWDPNCWPTTASAPVAVPVDPAPAPALSTPAAAPESPAPDGPATHLRPCPWTDAAPAPAPRATSTTSAQENAQRLLCRIWRMGYTLAHG
jgi:hypothetical protein